MSEERFIGRDILIDDNKWDTYLYRILKESNKYYFLRRLDTIREDAGHDCYSMFYRNISTGNLLYEGERLTRRIKKEDIEKYKFTSEFICELTGG